MLKITATPILGKDLHPGDLFSSVGPEYWDNYEQNLSVGEKVYIRTEHPAEYYQDLNETVYKITIERTDDELIG